MRKSNELEKLQSKTLTNFFNTKNDTSLNREFTSPNYNSPSQDKYNRKSDSNGIPDYTKIIKTQNDSRNSDRDRNLGKTVYNFSKYSHR